MIVWGHFPCCGDRARTFSVEGDAPTVFDYSRCRGCGQLYEARVWKENGEWKIGWRKLTITRHKREAVTVGFD